MVQIDLQDMSKYPHATRILLRFSDGVCISWRGAEIAMHHDPSKLETTYELQVPGPCPKPPHHRDERTHNRIHVNTIDYERARTEEWEQYDQLRYRPDWTDKGSDMMFQQEYQKQLYQFMGNRKGV